MSKVIFIFARNPETQQALSDHLNGSPSPNLKEYIVMFKLLRNEMYLVKGDQR